MLPAYSGPLVDRSAAPERVGLGMTIVLTLTTHMANANSNLPKTSYPKVCMLISHYTLHSTVGFGVVDVKN
jgi:hypothetical protein